MSDQTCGCGCGTMTLVTRATDPCGCGCECCGAEKPKEEQIAELRTLQASVDQRLAELRAG